MATKKKKEKGAGVVIIGGAAILGTLLLAFRAKDPVQASDEQSMTNEFASDYNMATGQIGKKFNIKQVTKSDTASNLNYTEQFNPPESIYKNASQLALAFMDKLQMLADSNNWTLGITSWYRSPYINTVVSGAGNSWHKTGQAVDIYLKDNVDGDNLNRTLVKAIMLTLEGNWNELILEGGILQPSSNNNYKLLPTIIHIAFVPGQNKGEIFTEQNKVYTPHTMEWLEENF